MSQLTTGSLQKIYNGGNVESPTVQVIDIRKLDTSGGQGTERFRLLISDGVNYFQSMLATQHNHLVSEGTLIQNTICRLDNFIANDVNKRKILIILSISVIGQAERVGNPTNVEQAGGAQSQVPAPAPAPTNNYQQQQQRPQYGGQQQYGGGGGNSYGRSNNNAPVGNVAQGHLVPIRALNPYQNKWVIKARVTAKGDIKHWNKGPGNEGKLVSVELMDSEGVEIRATFFKEAVDQFYDMLHVNKVYTFTNGRVKLANKRFSSVKNDHEINFGRDAQVMPVADDSTIGMMKVEAVPIKDIETVEPNAVVDVLGVVSECSEIQEFTSRAGKQLVKCEVVLVDESNATIRVTFWGEKAHELKNNLHEPHPVLGIRRCKVSDYGGRTLSTFGTSQVLFNPDMPEAGSLRQWYDNGGATAATSLSTAGGKGQSAPKPYNERHTLGSIIELGLGKGGDGKGDYVDVKAAVQYIKKDRLWYEACPEDGNNKKVISQPDGSYYCEATTRSYDTCRRRYIASVKLGDHTDTAWVTLFDDQAIKVFDITADEAYRLQSENPTAFEEAFDKALWKTFNMRLRVKEERVNDMDRVKQTVVSISPLDYVKESREIIEALRVFDA